MNITLTKTQIKELNIKILKLFFPASAFRFVDWSIAYGPESSGCWPTESNGKIYLCVEWRYVCHSTAYQACKSNALLICGAQKLFSFVFYYY